MQVDTESMVRPDPMSELLLDPERLCQEAVDVLVIGNGPAGVAVVEQLFEAREGLRIGVAERGGVLLLSHFNNMLANESRRKFLDRFGTHPWHGDLKEGMMLPAIGGRGIASGAHLRRFDDVDVDLWGPDGVWPRPVVQALARWYPVAEKRRRVKDGGIDDSAQAWVTERLGRFEPAPPPIGVDTGTGRGFDAARGYDSSAARLWSLLVRDRLETDSPRLRVATKTYVSRLIQDRTRDTVGEGF